MRQPVIVLCAACLLATAGSALAQASAIKRTVITRGDVSQPGREAVVAQVEIAPGGSAGRHTHPGDEISYFEGGEGELLIDGEPPRHLTAGQAFIVPAGKVHDARNPGKEPARLIGVYVIEKGQPLATPAK